MENKKINSEFFNVAAGLSEKDLNSYELALLYGQRSAYLVLNRIKCNVDYLKFENDIEKLNNYFSLNSGTFEEVNQQYDELITGIKASIEPINKEVD